MIIIKRSQAGFCYRLIPIQLIGSVTKPSEGRAIAEEICECSAASCAVEVVYGAGSAPCRRTFGCAR